MSRVKLPAVPGKKMTREAARRLYVQTDRNASYTHLPQAHVDAHEDILDELERRHPGIRREAIAGAPRHFDEPLDTGTRAHQEHMRREEGTQQADVEATRREMDGKPAPTPRPEPSPAAPAGGGNPRPNRSPALFGGARPLAGAKRARGKLRTVAGTAGSWGLYSYRVIGWGIGLSVLYLFVSRSETAGAGHAPGELLFGGFTAALGAIASPTVDPLSPRAKPAAALTSKRAAPVGRARTATPSPKTRPPLPAAHTPLGAVHR